MERPNTISGLRSKRAELLSLKKALEADLKKVICDLDHIDASIRLFDPALTAKVVARYGIKHRAQKGTVRVHVLTMLRAADGPLTSREITRAWMSDRGLRSDEVTYVMIRKRFGSCLTAMKADGMVRGTVQEGGYKGWELVRHA